jgi:DNA-binding HxlR family transcriptional regulator
VRNGTGAGLLPPIHEHFEVLYEHEGTYPGMTLNMVHTPQDVLESFTRCGDGKDESTRTLVRDMLERLGDKWTLLVIRRLVDGPLRFTTLQEAVDGISHRMLTRTLRALERDGMVSRTVHAVAPPRVDYRLTPTGESLGEAFCGVWRWAEANLETVTAARARFDTRGR